MKLDNSVKKKVIWNTNTFSGMFHMILGWKIELSLGWCYNYFLGSRKEEWQKVRKSDRQKEEKRSSKRWKTEKKTIFVLFPISDIFLQTYAISIRIKLGMPETTQMKDLSKGFTGITNFNPFFLCYGSKKSF